MNAQSNPPNKNLTNYCGECALQQSPAMLNVNPYKQEVYLELQKSVEINEGDSVKRKLVTQRFLQKPALICESCLSDIEDVPTAEPIYVSKSEQ